MARDFDDVESYERWCDENPELAASLPTSQTPRPGRHVSHGLRGRARLSTLEDGELRGDGAIIVLPPSLHSTGRSYDWMLEPGREIPIVDPGIMIGSASPRSTDATHATKRQVRLSQQNLNFS